MLSSKKNKILIIKAIDRRSRRVVAWVLGNRDFTTFQRLYDKITRCKNCIFYTDDWDAFAAVLLLERHVIGKSHTATIEQDDSNTRHIWDGLPDEQK